MELTVIDALRAYARMMNTLDSSHLEPLLADDFHYASQWVVEEIPSKQEFITYINGKLRAVADSGTQAYAEIGELQGHGGGPCVVMAQGTRDNVGATVLAQVKGGHITRLDMCKIPPPSAAVRSGEYPR